MRVILFAHPEFLHSFSMTHFSNMIADYLDDNEVEYEVWSPKALFHKLSPKSQLSKWLGYIDQYVVFPFVVRWKLRKQPEDTVFVFCDQALGPWVPLVAHRPHVIYCHDAMAIKSALGLMPKNPVSFSGRLYQRFICRGLKYGRFIICASKRTRLDIIKYVGVAPDLTRVLYHGLNYPFKKIPRHQAFEKIKCSGIFQYDRGCLLHVGGGQWYKNTEGIIRLYAEYCRRAKNPRPLLMLSPSLAEHDQSILDVVPDSGEVNFIQGIDSVLLEALYSYADVFLFPSLAEGFGWPIVEAQACGCPVITTNDAPMNEVGGPVATYLAPYSKLNETLWLSDGVTHIFRLLALSEKERSKLSAQSIAWADTFDAEKILSSYLEIYNAVIEGNEASLNVYDV